VDSSWKESSGCAWKYLSSWGVREGNRNGGGGRRTKFFVRFEVGAVGGYYFGYGGHDCGW
jgi:hypothetical protein